MGATAAPTTASGGGVAASDPCAFVTKQEAATALGEPVNDPMSTTLGTVPVGPGVTVVIAHCEFLSASGARYVQIDLWRTSGSSATQIRQVVEQLICTQKERVSGIGDVACWSDSSHTELQLLKGGEFLNLQISPDIRNPTDALRTLAMRAVSRAP